MSDPMPERQQRALDEMLANQPTDPTRSVPPGWYPDPAIAGAQRFWDGKRWTDNVAPLVANPPPSPMVPTNLLNGLILVAAVGGLILSQMTVTLMSGTGIVWVGAIVTVVAAVVAFSVSRVGQWVGVLCVFIAIAAVGSAISVESQLSDKREELTSFLEE